MQNYYGQNNGYFGFGIYESHAEYANLRVYRPAAVPLVRKYRPGSENR